MNLSYLKKIISLSILIFSTTGQLIGMRVTVTTETTVTKRFLTPYEQFKNACKEIDKKQKQKMNSFICKHNDESTHDQHIKIETKLRGLQSSIHTLEKEIMYSLQQEFSIIPHLRETFGDESIEKALTMANYYAAQAHKEFIYF
jgi:hypothetical protein